MNARQPPSFMFTLPHPHRPFIATVAIVCFGSGIVGAHSAHAIDSHVAVSEARAAAKIYEERRHKLESALSEAQAVSQQAASVTESEDVAAAVDVLEDATVRAASTARTAASAVVAAAGTRDGDDNVAPITATLTSQAPEVTSPADTPEDTASDTSERISTECVEPAGNTLRSQDGLAPQDEPAVDEPAADGEQATDNSTTDPATDESASDTDDSPGTDTHPAAPGDGSTAGGQAPEDSAQTELVVDSEQFTGPDDARAAAASLTAASEELESAAASVAAESRRLEVLAEDALLTKALSDFDTAVTDAQDAASDADARIDEVGERVADPAVLSAYASARANLRSMVSTTLDTPDSAAALARLEALREAVVAHADALTEVRTSHEEWIATENAARAEKNDEAEAAYETDVAQARERHADANRAAVTARRNGWSGQPSGVAGANGRLTLGSLEQLDFAPGHYLQSDAAAALEAADDAYYAQTGAHLSLTDSYRSYALQVRTRATKPGTAAVPGTSNHGWGMAIDMEHASARWLAANGAQFGWVHPAWARPGGSKPEWWHLEYVATEVGEFDAPEEPTRLKDLVSVFDDDED